MWPQQYLYYQTGVILQTRLLHMLDCMIYTVGVLYETGIAYPLWPPRFTPSVFEGSVLFIFLVFCVEFLVLFDYVLSLLPDVACVSNIN